MSKNKILGSKNANDSAYLKRLFAFEGVGVVCGVRRVVAG